MRRPDDQTAIAHGKGHGVAVVQSVVRQENAEVREIDIDRRVPWTHQRPDERERPGCNKAGLRWKTRAEKPQERIQRRVVQRQA